jgi:hypothetical protein
MHMFMWRIALAWAGPGGAHVEERIALTARDRLTASHRPPIKSRPASRLPPRFPSSQALPPISLPSASHLVKPSKHRHRAAQAHTAGACTAGARTARARTARARPSTATPLTATPRQRAAQVNKQPKPKLAPPRARHPTSNVQQEFLTAAYASRPGVGKVRPTTQNGVKTHV